MLLIETYYLRFNSNTSRYHVFSYLTHGFYMNFPNKLAQLKVDANEWKTYSEFVSIHGAKEYKRVTLSDLLPSET
ncbi:hypothetical protein [Vibrio phage BUCT194]|uniref:Uncharacterized protein n=1 Tax=Vibrio phage BUCT194 TaxID=2859072 RepID=A0AAE8XFL7_9CAUD|nr:hypothetical protein PP741_gp019 [Vibrio phage BUCT194]UAW01206.1 hypothetical protein [Vibrio phage BUCT194]